MHHAHVEHRDGGPPRKCWLLLTEHAARGHRMGLVHPGKEGGILFIQTRDMTMKKISFPLSLLLHHERTNRQTDKQTYQH